jgi:hypothetical protein
MSLGRDVHKAAKGGECIMSYERSGGPGAKTPIASRDAGQRSRRDAIADKSTVKVKAQGSDSDDFYEDAWQDEPPASPASSSRQRQIEIAQWGGMILLAVVETGLLLISLLPGSIDQRLGWSTNGPFPDASVPLITAIFYLAPFLTGLLARRWEIALLLAMAPTWASLGLYTIASASRQGIFALTNGAHPTYVVGTIELFAALGFIGWLTRRAIFIVRTGRS